MNGKCQLADPRALAADIRRWAAEFGFQRAGISDTTLDAAESHLASWILAGFHGEMAWMARHGSRRTRPEELVPGTIRVISARMNYFPRDGANPAAALRRPGRAYVARYALGRDYHRLVRRRLQQLADRIEAVAGPFGYRVFTDSAPVMERALAEKAGLGWIGKNTCLIDRHDGSWFFIGEIYTDLPLPIDAPAADLCGSCRACLDACPTGAIVAPHRLDARRCISYLTIELDGAIPEPLRRFIGNRIFGCDDCQLVCPWNRAPGATTEAAFEPRQQLDSATLPELFRWSESDFVERTRGSVLRRLGYERWLRNIAVALGNGPPEPAVIEALESRRRDPSPLVREHVGWALTRLRRLRHYPPVDRAENTCSR